MYIFEEKEWLDLQKEGISACEKRRFPQAEVAFAKALKLIQDNHTTDSGVAEHEKHPDQLDEKLACSLNNLASACQAQGKYSLAQDYFLQAMELHKKLSGEESLGYVASLHNLAMVYGAKKDFKKAEELFRQALAIKEKLLGPEHPELKIIQDNLARLLAMAGKSNRIT